jgi:hypothetical protein
MEENVVNSKTGVKEWLPKKNRPVIVRAIGFIIDYRFDSNEKISNSLFF